MKNAVHPERERRSPGGRSLPRQAAWLLLAAVACTGGCSGRDGSGRGARDAIGGVMDAARTGVEEMHRTFEQNAAQVRNELDAARSAAEAAVRERLDSSRAALARAQERAERIRSRTQQARRRAEEALQRGSEILQQAAHDGGDAAESWARLIQDRMIRLEESLDALRRSDPEHADS
jgi:hypothetical protein